MPAPKTCLSVENLEMLALSNQGLSAGRIAPRFGISRNAVIGRLVRVREALAKESAPSAPPKKEGGAPPPLKRGEDNAPVSIGLIAGNSEDRGAHLDSLIWKRRSYLADLKAEGGHSGGPIASLREGQS